MQKVSDTSTHFHCDQDASMSLNANTDKKIRIDDLPSMPMESPMSSDSACPTYNIPCTNTAMECTSTHQIQSQHVLHNYDKLHKASVYTYW